MIYQPGSHGLLDLYACDVNLLRDECRLKTILHQAAGLAGATVLSSHFHTFGGEGGVTGVLLLAESHISIHTWPEHAYAALDIFLCGNHELEQVKTFLEQSFESERSDWKLCARGDAVPQAGFAL